MGTSSDSKMTQPANANPVQAPGFSLAEMPTSGPVNSSGANQYSMIGKSIVIKGEIVASDPVYVYGSVEGSISAPAHRVTIGKEGRVKADIGAREIVIMGDVCGNLEGGERVEIRNDGSLMGNIETRRIYIEEGAVLSGVIDVHKSSKKEKAEARGEQAIEPEASELERGSVVNFPVAEMAEEIAS
jgi:cytoskeletal protein CcmA (bactofilin family)